MFKIMTFIYAVTVLMLLVACRQEIPTSIVETVVVKETVPVKETVIVMETILVTETVVVKETVPVEESFVITVTEVVTKVVNVMVTPTTEPPTPAPTVDLLNDKVNEVLNRIPMVQHHYDIATEIEHFTCAGNRGLNSVNVNSEGAIYVGPDSGDFSLRGIIFLFEVSPAGEILAAPQNRMGKLLNVEREEVYRVSLDEVLTAVANDDAIWSGSYEALGRGNCLETFEK